MKSDFLTEEEFVPEEQTETPQQQKYEEFEHEYSENGFKKYINKYKNSPFFWPVIIVLLILLIGTIIFSVAVNSTGKLKSAKVTAPSVIYLGENETISAESIGSGNLRATSFHYDISNSSIVELTSKAGKTGKKTTNELIPITTGKFLLYVDAELENNKIERIEKEIIICKAFTEQAIQREKITLIKGKSHTIHLDLGTEECYENIEYRIEDEEIAIVDENGKVTALATGETNLIIFKNKKEIEIAVKVIDPKNEKKVTGLIVDKDSLSIEIKSTAKINATVLPENATNKSLKWVSSNNSVATVSNKGVVKGIGKGNAKITVTTIDGEYKKEIIVTVKQTNKITNNSTNKNIKVTGIKLNKSQTTILVGNTETITAIVSPSNATNKKIKWTSSNSKVASVSQMGKIKGEKEGTAIIIASSGGEIAKIKVTVSKKEVAVTSITISPNKKTIKVGEEYLFTTAISPSNATNPNITWTSSDKRIATVSKGKVKGIKEGTITITATTNNGKKSIATIIVEKALVADNKAPILSKIYINEKEQNVNNIIVKANDRIKLLFNEKLSQKPAVLLAGTPVTVNLSNDKYSASYTIPSNIKTGNIEMHISSYKDLSGIVGGERKINIKVEGVAQENNSSDIDSYTIKYNANSGTGSIQDQKVKYGTSTKLTKNDNKIKKSGYEFIGWKAKNSSGKIRGCTNDLICDSNNKTLDWYDDSKIKTYYLYFDNATVSKTEKPGKTVTMIAQWIKLEKTKSTNIDINTTQLSYKVTTPNKVPLNLYVSTESSSLGSNKLSYVSTETKSFKVSRKNIDYKLYIKVCLEQNKKICNKQQSVTIPANAFKVIYNSGNGKGTMKEQYIVHGQSTKLRKNTFTKDGYKFLGWVAKKSDGKRNGCTSGTICNSSNSNWYDISKIYSYFIYKDEQAISKTVEAGQTVEMIALWGKLKTASATNCSSNYCDISWSIDSSSRISWDLYYNNTKSSSSKNIMGSNSGTMTDFIRETSNKTITVKACLTSNSSICTNSINVTIKAKSVSASNQPSQQESTGMSTCCLIISNKKIVYNKTAYSKYTWDKISNYGIYDYSKVCVRTNGTISALGGGYITTKNACEKLNN